jgi:hypothetical protein
MQKVAHLSGFESHTICVCARSFLGLDESIGASDIVD